MSEGLTELQHLLESGASVPLSQYMDQLTSLAAGTAGMAQLLQGFEQQLLRLEQLHAPGARALALEIAAVGRATGKRRAGTVAEGLTGWRKVGLDGELLRMDSEQWAAAVDLGYELMWSVNTGLHAELPHPFGRRQWKAVQKKLADLNSSGWCGFRDWRVPTWDELLTLQHTASSGSAFTLSKQLFPDVQGDAKYWSSTSAPDVSESLRALYFAEGRDGAAPTTAWAYVRFVRTAVAYG